MATSALGMGFDKPDLGFVIRYQALGSAIAYYQQVGRAGRALPHAPDGQTAPAEASRSSVPKDGPSRISTAGIQNASTIFG